MTPIQIAILSLRLLAILTIIETIPYLKSLTEAFAWQGMTLAGDRQFNTDLILFGTILSLVLQFAIGLFLYAYAKGLAKRMIADEESDKSLTELSAKKYSIDCFLRSWVNNDRNCDPAYCPIRREFAGAKKCRG